MSAEFGKNYDTIVCERRQNKKMGRKPKMATQEEVLEFFTSVMRQNTKDEVKISEAISAADKLYRYFRDTTAPDSDQKETGVVILPEIRQTREEEKE